jgi:hypothetical protein
VLPSLPGKDQKAVVKLINPVVGVITVEILGLKNRKAKTVLKKKTIS